MFRSAETPNPQPTYAQASQKTKKPAAIPSNALESKKEIDNSLPQTSKLPSTTTANQAHSLIMNGTGKKPQTPVSISRGCAFNAPLSSTTSIQFGSINLPNQPTDEPTPNAHRASTYASGIQSGGGPSNIPNRLQFGTLPCPNLQLARTPVTDIPGTNSAHQQYNPQNPDYTHFTQGTTAAPVVAPHRHMTRDFATSESSANAPIHMHPASHIPQPFPPIHTQSHHPQYMPQNHNNPIPPLFNAHSRNTHQYHNQKPVPNTLYAAVPPPYNYTGQASRREVKLASPLQPGSMPPQQPPYSTSPNTSSAYPSYPQQPIGVNAYPHPPFYQSIQHQRPMTSSAGDIKIPTSRKINIVDPETKKIVNFNINKESSTTTAIPVPEVAVSTPIAATKSATIIHPTSTPSPRVSHAVPIVNPNKPVQVEPIQPSRPERIDDSASTEPKDDTASTGARCAESNTKPETLVAAVTSAAEVKSDVLSTINLPDTPSEIVQAQKEVNKTDATPVASAHEVTPPIVEKVTESKAPETNSQLSEIAAKDDVSSVAKDVSAVEMDSKSIVEESTSTCETVAASEEGDTAAEVEELEEGEILEESEKKNEDAEVKKEVSEIKKNSFHHGIDLSRSVSAPSMATGSPRNMVSLEGIRYPAEITPTTPTVDGKFKYDRDFLMQFMNICREKPSNLQEMKATPSDHPVSQSGQPQRKGASVGGRHDPSSAKTAAYGAMGQFGFNKSVPKSSSQRFEESNQLRGIPPSRLGRSSSGSSLLPPTMMGSSIMGIPPRPDDRRRNQNTRGARDDRRGGGRQGGPQPLGLTIPIDQVVPLQMSETRWVARPVTVTHTADGRLAPEIAEKKVKGLLNKLTLEKFGSISSQIITIANQSEKEDDGASLKSVIRIIFEKATDEPGFVGMYAQLCKVMMDTLSDKVVDLEANTKDGKPITGGILFRKYLLNRCQEDFEKGWKVEDGEAQPAASTAPGEEILTEEYYAAQKKKRRGLGLIQFIGELFKLTMLTENIMHQCVRRLLSNVESPEEEETESLCKLMTTIGRQLDHSQAQNYVNTYFERMTALSKNEDLPSRIRYMVQDVIDLRKDNWVPRRTVAAPKTIAQIHQDAAKAKSEAAQAEVLRRSASSGSRGMPNLSQQLQRPQKVAATQDGWSTVKAGSLSGFGKFSKGKGPSGPVALGPGGSMTSMFGAEGSKGWQNDKRQTEESRSLSLSRTSSQNKFSALETVVPRRPSVDESQPSPSDRPPRLNLLPKGSTVNDVPVAEASPVTVKSPEEVRKLIQDMMKEFWSVHDSTIASIIVKEDIQNPDFHVEIVEEFLLNALEKKPVDVKAVCQTFEELQNTISADHFKEAFGKVSEQMDDISIDAPQAPMYFGQMLASAGLSISDFEEITKDLSPRLASKIMEHARS